MADSVVEIAVKSSESSILTEEMIDAAMSKRLDMLQEEIKSSYDRRVQDEHSYCADDDCDDSSGSDFNVISVIDGETAVDISNSIKETTSDKEEKGTDNTINKQNDETVDLSSLSDRQEENNADEMVVEQNFGKPDNQILVTNTSEGDKQVEGDVMVTVQDDSSVNSVELLKNSKEKYLRIDSSDIILECSDKVLDNLGLVVSSSDNQEEKDRDVGVIQPNAKILDTEALISSNSENQLENDKEVLFLGHNKDINNKELIIASNWNKSSIDTDAKILISDERTKGGTELVKLLEKKPQEVVFVDSKEDRFNKKLDSETNQKSKNCTIDFVVNTQNKPNLEANEEYSSTSIVTDKNKVKVNPETYKLTTETSESVTKPFGNLKQSLSVKPISNLLRGDFVVKDKNIKIFKCVQGMIEMMPGTSNKYFEDMFPKRMLPDNSSNSNTVISSESETCGNQSTAVKNKNLDPKSHLNNIIRKGFEAIHEEDDNVEGTTVSKKRNDNILKSGNDIGQLPVSENKSSDFNSKSTSNPNDESIKEHLNIDLKSTTISKDSFIKINEIDNSIPNVKNNKNINNFMADSKAGGDSEKSVTSSSAPSINRMTDLCLKNIKLTDAPSKVSIKPNSKTILQRRQILPKINYRYRTKDKLIISDQLPKNNIVTLSKKINDNFFILPDGSKAAQPLLLMSPDVNKNNNAITNLNSPSSNPVPLKFVVSKVNTSTSTVEFPSMTKSVCNTSQSQNPPPIVLKDKCVGGKTWEKVDQFTLRNESTQQKLEEFNVSSLKAQLLEREVPLYKPADCNKFYTCLDCNDRFVLESSLRNHRFRKSVLVKYWCRTCSCSLNMYNRCMFLAHIRSHSQLVKHIDMSSLSIEPLPKSLIKLGPNEENIDNFSTQNTINQSVTNTSSILVSANSQSENSKPSSIIHSLSSGVMNANDKRPFANTQRFVKTVPKLVPSRLSSDKNLDNECNNTTDRNNDKEDENTDFLMNVEPEISIVDLTSSKSSLVSPLKRNDGPSAPSTSQSILLNNGVSVGDTRSQNIDSVEDLTKSKKVSESQNKVKTVKGKRKCPECDLAIAAKGSLRKHLQNGNRPGSSSLKCNVCRLILPTNCALKMHLRIHMKLRPFRCPECAIEFHIFDRFLMHLKYTCCHLTKCIRYVCTLCGNMQLSIAALEQHLMMRHVRPIFKCGGCPVAFVTLKSVEKHKEKAHPGVTVATYSYNQCRLCPEKLIPKKKFLNHLKGHINDDRLCIYAYQCPTCKNTFFQRTELIYHRMQCDTRDGIIKSVLSSPPISPVNDKIVEHISNSNIDNSNVEDEEKEILLPSKKRKLDNYDEIEIIEDEQDPLSLEGFQATEEPLKEPLIELCVVCKKEKVVMLPGENQSSQSLCCKKCVRPCGETETSKSVKFISENRKKLQAAKLKYYKCKICKSTNSMDLKMTYEHFKTFHKELEGQSINEWLIIENKSQLVKRSSTIATAEIIKEKYNKKKKMTLFNTQSIAVVKQELREGEERSVREQTMSMISDMKKTKRLFKPKMKVIERKSFESGQIIESEAIEKTGFKCSKCDLIANSKDELRDHVVCHRTDPNSLQCLECGDFFVVLPSLEKHLIINHRIIDVKSYIDSNKQYIDGSTKKDDMINDENAKESEEDNLICKVCHESFQSKTALDKHFRSHGMAFLFKNLLQ